MLATPASKPFDRPGWIFELKYDGFRLLAIREGRVRLLTRRGNDLAPAFPEIVACLMELESPAVASGDADSSGNPARQAGASRGAVRPSQNSEPSGGATRRAEGRTGNLPDLAIDGELVVLDDTGKADFERLRRRALPKKKISIDHAAKADPAALECVVNCLLPSRARARRWGGGTDRGIVLADVCG
jgi:ATP-dependent DNA ligase